MRISMVIIGILLTLSSILHAQTATPTPFPLLECRDAATPVAHVADNGDIWTAASVIIDDLLCILESVGDACYTIINGNDNASDITSIKVVYDTN